MSLRTTNGSEAIHFPGSPRPFGPRDDGLIVIVGPTGSGKSNLAIQLAQKINGEIINADSRQVYRELNIGVGKPSADDFKKIPHHLFGIISIDDKWDAAQFVRLADQAIDDIVIRKKVPIIVGGTGLHVKALLFGLFEGPPADEKIRDGIENEIESRGLEAVYRELEKIDPEAARKIHTNDSVRIIRAIEVFRSSGKKISDFQVEHGFQKARYKYQKFGILKDRAQLYDDINRRVDVMIENGLEDEVRQLVGKFGRHPLLERAIGYQEWYPYLEKSVSKESVIDLIKQNTRKYAKRQLTWFGNEDDVKWISGLEALCLYL